MTTFCDAGPSFAEIDHFKKLARQGRLEVRLWVMIGESNQALAKRLPDYRIIGVGSHPLTVRAIKRFIDGALGTHGAFWTTVSRHYGPGRTIPRRRASGGDVRARLAAKSPGLRRALRPQGSPETAGRNLD